MFVDHCDKHLHPVNIVKVNLVSLVSLCILSMPCSVFICHVAFTLQSRVSFE